MARVVFLICLSFFSYICLSAPVPAAQPLKPTPTTQANRLIWGRTEQGIFKAFPHHPLLIRIDTGAKVASLDARNIQIFYKQKKPWVRFIFAPKTSKPFEPIAIEKPVLGFVTIKHHPGHQTQKDTDKRPLIQMDVCIGKQWQSIVFNLVDRKTFKYPVLLGRNALRKYKVLVDPTVTTLQPLDCAEKGSS
jgi:hypothetical protein